MANYANLEAAIVAAVYENANNEITGAALQSVLLQMVSSMGKSGMLCNGVADSSTTPPVNPDSNIFYIAPTGTYPNFGGLVVADGEWAIFIYNGSWQKQSVPVVTADAVPTTGSTNPVQSGGVADALEQKADIDGYYSTLTAGAAENLIGRGTVPAEYTRRTSGGSADIGSGAAAIEKIHGNTIVWNQQIQNGNFASSSGWSGQAYESIAVSSGTLTATVNSSSTQILAYRSVSVLNGHTYLVRYQVKLTTSSTGVYRMGYVGSSTQFFGAFNAADATNWVTLSDIFTANSNKSTIYIGPYGSVAFAVGNKMELRNVCLFDLSLMGLDLISSADDFNALFPLGWYDYNTGSLVSLIGTGISTNGFNQWEEEWEVYAGTRIKSKNPIPVFPSTTYYLEIPSPNVATVDLLDDSLNIISTRYNVGNSTFTTPANCRYLLFYVLASYGNVYKNDICLNLSWSGYRNGEYEAYWDSTLALPITTVTSGGSAVFADGMKGAMAAYDELTSTKAVKRIEKVNLGSLSWTYDSVNQQFISADLVGTIEEPAAPGDMPNAICSKYITVKYAGLSGDKCLNVIFASSSAHGKIYLRDSAYSDAPTFTTAMNGVYMYYALATPVEYTLDSEVNLNYRVDDFGTETLLPQNTATPTTAPIVYDVRYAMNAVDTLRNLPTNYISKDSLKNLLDALVSAGVISAYTMTYNAGTEQYTFTITA